MLAGGNAGGGRPGKEEGSRKAFYGKKEKKKKGRLLGLREFTSWIKRKWDFMEKDQHKQSLEARNVPDLGKSKSFCVSGV